MKLYGYAIGPTDYWPGCTLLRDYLTRPDDWTRPWGDSRAVKRMFADAVRLARDQGHWEGDFSMGPFIAGVPSGDLDTHLILSWKQSNNGTTYVFSTVELPWLLHQTMWRMGAAS